LAIVQLDAQILLNASIYL